MKMEECKKFESCSAPICALDPDYKIRVHMPEDRVCLYLREYAKKPTRANLRVSVPSDMYESLVTVSNDLLSREKGDKFNLLRKRILESGNNPSKLFNDKLFGRSK